MKRVSDSSLPKAYPKIAFSPELFRSGEGPAKRKTGGEEEGKRGGEEEERRGGGGREERRRKRGEEEEERRGGEEVREKKFPRKVARSMFRVISSLSVVTFW